MDKVVNLNRFRKAQAKAEQVRQAENNRASYGRSKSQKDQTAVERDRAGKDLDDKKLT